MSKALRGLVLFLVFDAVVVGAYFGIKALRSGRDSDPTAGAVWVTMDAYYQPSSELEQVIKTDYEVKELLPLQFRNFGRSASVLKSSAGRSWPGPASPSSRCSSRAWRIGPSSSSGSKARRGGRSAGLSSMS